MNKNIVGAGRLRPLPKNPVWLKARPLPVSAVFHLIATEPSNWPVNTAFDLALEPDRTAMVVVDSIPTGLLNLDFAGLENRIARSMDKTARYAERYGMGAQRLIAMADADFTHMRPPRIEWAEQLAFYERMREFSRSLNEPIQLISNRVAELGQALSTSTGRIWRDGPMHSQVLGQSRRVLTESDSDGHFISFDIETSFDEAWLGRIGIPAAPEPVFIKTRGRYADDPVMMALAVDVARSLGAIIPDNEGFMLSDLTQAGISLGEFEEKLEFRRKIAGSTVVRVLRRHRRTFAGITLVDALTELGTVITIPNPTGLQ